MDKHDIAHYAIAGAIAASIGGVYTAMPARAPDPWASVTVQAARDFARKDSLHPLIYCADDICREAAQRLTKALKAPPSPVIYHLPDGLTVGAKTQTDADALAKEVRDNFGLIVKDAVPGQPNLYISFGAPLSGGS